MTEWQHHDAARWWNLSLAEQFGNVGSEISRAIRWSTKNPETAQAAFYRGLDLFDLMLDGVGGMIGAIVGPMYIRRSKASRERVAALGGLMEQRGVRA